MSIILQWSCFKKKIRPRKVAGLYSHKTVLYLVCKQVHTKSAHLAGVYLTTPLQHYANHREKETIITLETTRTWLFPHTFFLFVFRSGFSLACGCQLTQLGAFLFGLENLKLSSAGVKSMWWFMGVESTYSWPQTRVPYNYISLGTNYCLLSCLFFKKSHSLHFNCP